MMNKKLAQLVVDKKSDYYDSVVRGLEDAGFLIVFEFETTTERYYIVAESEDNE